MDASLALHQQQGDAMASEVPEVIFIDNPHAPEVHTTGHAGLYMHMDNVHVTLGAGRVNHITSPGPINHVVVGRFVMPALAALELAKQIQQMLENPGGPSQAPSPASPLH
ncbi:hypothetical protein [Variovorax saccharolyticus]|uniref:hypothetical protein n=1 Tax=Variovorax saccharolyticus TaxID=3053516 RepID=UPI00257726D0|nr:hypothetical protein [Variovorax sp. J31P216]MDM0029644.1 hypothetical protein [Variovorax sp. J31P216]